MSAPPRWEALREDLAALHGAALAAADPGAAVARSLALERGGLRAGGRVLPLAPGARVHLVAFGKASLGMARAAVAAIGPRLARGVIAHPHSAEDAGGWPDTVVRVGAAHPLPDEGSLRAGEAALSVLGEIPEGDVGLVLVSGGGSALLEALRPGIGLGALRAVTRALMHAGADIVELNTVRRALSRTKAGGLSRAAGAAPLASLILSDVVGDPLESIASGPTIPASPPIAAAREVLERRSLAAQFPEVGSALAGAGGGESAGPGGERVPVVVGSNRVAAEALLAVARARGFHALLLTDRMQGEAREVGRLAGAIARGMRETGIPCPVPGCLVMGGETTVTVRGEGRGGRNLELALGAAVSLAGAGRTAVFSFATDGMDGSSGAAGAIATGETLARAAAIRLDAARAFEASDTAPFFEALGDLWVTGLSGTNVNDLVVALTYP